jgi:dCTP deaminase
MKLLTKPEIVESLDSKDDDSLFIDPLLDTSQIGAVSIDLRLGYDFQVSILTRKPSISPGIEENQRSIQSYFQETRRKVGETFVIYPNQLVIGTTLEYISLPTTIYADVLSRSSYTRLGVMVNTMVQPGWRGCFPLELANSGSTPIELTVGARIVQCRLSCIDDPQEYLRKDTSRKYHGDVRPTISRADKDPDLEILSKMRNTE